MKPSILNKKHIQHKLNLETMSNPIKCLHTADLHFGMENYGQTNPKTGLHSRLEDFSRSMGQLVDYALNNEVDVVLFAGDAYKRNSPSPTEQRELAKHFIKLADAGIPIVMIAGNHDIPVMQGKATAVDIFRQMRPEKIQVYNTRPSLDPHPPLIETKNGPIGVCCMPFLSPSYFRHVVDTEGLSQQETIEEYNDKIHDIIEGMAKALPEEIPKVLMAHMTAYGTTLGGYKGSPLFMDELTVQPSVMANAGYDYVALGHIHLHQNLSPVPNVPVIYSGSIDRVDFGEMDEDKGFVMAYVEKGGSEFDYHPVDVREMIHIKAHTERGGDLTEGILNEIQKEASRLDGSILRISYTADDDEVHTLDMKRIHEALKPVHFKAGFYRQIRDTQEQQRRSRSLSTEITFADAFNAYLQEHEEFQDDKEELLKRALEIEKKVKSPTGIL